VSLVGPGFFPLEQLAILRSAHMTLGAEPKIDLDAASGMAYAVYGVYGFDGDNGPTSARLTADSASGQLYVGFSDYEHGHWIFSGPFTMPAGGGTLEAEIPNTGEYVSAAAFVGSPYRATYLAVLVPEGGSLSGAAVELGVHGGSQGPQPCRSMSGLGGSSGMMLHWEHSPSYLDPDFAGYLIERAPRFAGSFTRLNSAPVRDDWMSDPGAQVGEAYRYRVAALDASANMSTWATGPGSRSSGELMAPVPVVNLPHGPLFGPVTLNIDMGGSYDPEGGVIDNYEIQDAEGDVLYSSPAYVVNREFQPGCYTLRFIVSVGARYGSSTRMLKVYPQWRDHAVLVSAPATQVSTPTLAAPTAMYDAGSATAYLSGYDLYSSAYVVEAFSAGSATVRVLRIPTLSYQPALFTAEPVQMAGEFFAPMSFELWIGLMHVTSSEVSWLLTSLSFGTQTNDRAAFATDGTSKLWEVKGWDSGGYRLVIKAVHGAGSAYLLDPAPDLIALDAVYNPSANAVEVVYSAPGTTEWMRADADSLAVVDSAQIAPLSSPSVDIEYFAEVGEPCVAYCSGGIVRYRQHTGAGWSAEEQPDPTGNHLTSMDLEVVTNGVRIAIGEIGGQASTYRMAGPGVWTKRDINHATATNSYLNMAPCSDTGEDYLVADSATNRHVYFARENGDGTEDMIYDRPPTVGQGFEMHGAGGGDGLHAVWRNLLGSAVHVIGSPDGESWAHGVSLGDPDHLDLVALKDGTVYLSRFEAGSATLAHWDGVCFAAGPNVISAVDYRPFFAKGRPSTMFSWAAYDPGTSSWVVYQGNESAPYDTASALCQEGPAYDGVGLIQSTGGSPGYSTDYLALHGGAALTDSEIGLYGSIFYLPAFMFKPSDSPGFMYSTFVRGRTLAAAQYFLNSGVVRDAYYMSNGAAYTALRYTPYSFYPASERTELYTNMDDPYADARRTVSAMTTQSGTAVALICDLGGHEVYMEWSGFNGEWEQLPLPGPDTAFSSEGRMSQAELFTGLDGRWHILYRDWNTDEIYCRSTL
jgi:hypothetical protein